MRLFVAALLTLTLIFAASCGPRCTARETIDCSTNFSACQSACVSDKACLDKCTVSYCDCLDDAGCDKTGSCNP